MDKMTEQIAEIFKRLEDEELIAKCRYQEIDARYREMADERERAYCEWQSALRAFSLVDALQEIVEKKEEASSE